MDEETELHRELLVRLDEIDQRALDAVERVELPEYEREVALGLSVAAWEVFKGIRALVERRLAEEALMLSRTLLEDTVKLMWLAREPDELQRRAIRYGLTSAKYARDVATTARANGWAWADELPVERAKEITALRGAAKAAGLGDEPERFPRTWELLSEVGRDRLAYWYARASQSVHSTVIGVSARIDPAEREGESNQIRMRSPLDEGARLGMMAAEFFMTSLHASSFLLPWGGSEEIQSFCEEISAKLQDLFSRITGKPISGAVDEPQGPALDA